VGRRHRLRAHPRDPPVLEDAGLLLPEPRGRRRDELGRAALRFLHDDAPFIFLYQEKATIGLAKSLAWNPVLSDQRLRSMEFRSQ